MVTLTDIKKVLGIDPDDSSEDHYLQNLIRRASFRISSACNRQLEYRELIEYFCGSDSLDLRTLYLKNWPVWVILQLQEFNSNSGDYEDVITGFGDTIMNSVNTYEGKKPGLIRLMKDYTFVSNCKDNCGQDYRIKYKAGYKNILGKGTVAGNVGTTEVTGDKTFFETEFRIGDRLIVGNYEYIVSEILSDTSLNVSSNIETSINKESFRICNVPADLAEAVLMLAAGSYLLKKYEAYGMDQKTESVSAALYDKIKSVLDINSLNPNVKMRFREFDLSSVVDAYRRVNV